MGRKKTKTISSFYNYDVFESWKYAQTHPDTIKNWFPKTQPQRFNWGYGSYYLARNCYKDFDIWWNENRYSWNRNCQYLAKHCYMHFDKWWNEDKWNYDMVHYLFKYVPEKYEIWWKPEKVSDKEIIRLHKEYPKYKHVWGGEYLKRKITNKI